METLEKVFTGISKNLDRIAGLVILPAISIVVIADVFLRYVFNSPFIWGLEFNEWMLLMIFALAIPECTRQNGHIRMELVISNLSPRLQAIFDTVYVFCGITVFFLLGRIAWEEFLFNLESYREGLAVTEYVGLPDWGHDLTVLVMCVILVIYYLLRLAATLVNAKEFSRTEATGMED